MELQASCSPSRTRRRSLYVVLSLVGPSSSAFADGESRSFAGQGEVVAIGKPNERIRAEARSAALGDAVENAVEFLGGPSPGESASVDDHVYQRSRTFVLSCEDVREETEDNILTLQVRAAIDLSLLRAHLREAGWRKSGRARRKHAGRTVLVLATEQLGPDQIISWTEVVWRPKKYERKTHHKRVHRETGVVQATFSRELKKARMKVVDPNVLRGKLKKMKAFTVADLGDEAATTIARRTDASYVVICRGSVDLTRDATLAQANMRSAQANVVARMIRTKDGEVVASTSEHAAQIHIDPETARIKALREAATLSSRALLEQFAD